MVSSTGTSLGKTMSVFTDEQLDSLERTYGRVRHPVWIRDRSDRCVYRNPSACRDDCRLKSSMVFDIMDHRGAVVGTLTTVIN